MEQLGVRDWLAVFVPVCVRVKVTLGVRDVEGLRDAVSDGVGDCVWLVVELNVRVPV